MEAGRNGINSIFTVLPHYPKILDWVLARPHVRVIGINAPQGAGKTTLCRYLCEGLAREGKRAIALSIDDFYITRAEQEALARAHPKNPYWQARGYPGTHDISLGTETLGALTQLKAGESIRIPRYDKSAFHGKGDRLPREEWPLVSGPLDFIFVEGWMFGFPPADPQSISDESLREINDRLPAYQAWTDFCDAFIQFEAASVDFIVNWRIQAEKTMRDSGKPAMPESEARAYIETFMPAYLIYPPILRLNYSDNYLHLVLSEDRTPVH